MGGTSRIVLFVGLVVVAVAGYVGYVHNVVTGSSELPTNLVDSTTVDHPSTSENAPTDIQQGHHVKDSSELHHTIQNLQVPCGFIIDTSLYKRDPSALNTAAVNPLDTILDPSLTQSTITRDVVMADRYLKILYEEAGDSTYIPAQSLWLRMGSLEATIPSPSLLVIDADNSRFKIRLGRDFMRSNQATIDLDEMELYLSIGDNPKVMVPFLQSRDPPDFSATSGDEL